MCKLLYSQNGMRLTSIAIHGRPAATSHSVQSGFARGVRMGPVAAMHKARQLLEGYSSLPKVLVLDLDYTVWPYWCEMYSPSDRPPGLYPEASAIIDACRERKVIIAAASRTPTPDVARAFMHKLGLDVKFDNIQLIPAANGYDSCSAQKDTCHLPNIREATGWGYASMLFFDDEMGNVAKVARLGVCSVQVPTSIGLCLKTFSEGLDKFAAQQQAQ
ncbi:acid phosphatase-domain-containing protein [Scenedesmus sp. NREL 46B-D3]|nr:acid phosphatase-domain-containing protein [Scenedesmus sp. NREL 46B-D3]